MKKIIALALTLVLVLSMSVTVFAEEILQNGYSDPAKMATDTQNITLTIAGTPTVAKVYYVAVTWNSLEFTYTFDSNAKWDPLHHTYTNNTNGTWSAASTITAANHSNDNVNVTASVTDSIANDGITVTVDNTGAQNLDAAIPGTAYGDADFIDFKVTPTGVPADLDVADDVTIATIKITFAAGAV